MLVVADTSPINYLILIQHELLLPTMYTQVRVPPTVLRELEDPETPEAVRTWVAHPPAWFERRAPQQALLQNNPVLLRSINVRNPYVDPLNLVQVELLRQLRHAGHDTQLHDALLVTINGIAAGMRNTG